MMEIDLQRTYLTEATNGSIFHEGTLICYCIELPWKNNERKKSCIPEGIYRLRKRYSQHFGRHIEIMGVPDRSLILFHPANNAQKELKGCVAPVSKITGAGMGEQSRLALEKLKSLIDKAFDENEIVILRVNSKIQS